MTKETTGSVGIDTASLLFRVSSTERDKLAAWLPYERGHKLGAKHHYGNFDRWSATLHERDFRSDNGGAVLVVTASLPRLLFDENATPVGAVGAAEARSRLCDAIESACGLCLHRRDYDVSRVDFCLSLAHFPDSRAVIGALRSVELPHRQTAAMSNGVAFYARDTKATVYDKLNEIARGASRLALAARNEERREMKVGETLEALVTRGATAEELEDHRARLHVGERRRERLDATKRAIRRLGVGAVRLEVRLTGSRAITDALQVAGIDRGRVLSEDAAFAVLAPLVARLNGKLAAMTLPAAVVALRSQMPAARMQRLIALLVLVGETGTLDLAADALGMSHAAANRLASEGTRLGVSRLTRVPSLAVIPLDQRAVTRTTNRERRLDRKWQETRTRQNNANSSWSSLLPSVA